MLKDYVLGAEVAKKGNFHIANISMLLKDFGLVEGIDFLKYGGITLLNKKSLRCPKYIEVLMWNKSMTDLSELLALPFFKDTLDGNISYLRNKYTIVKIEGKQFIKITDTELNEVMMNERLVKAVVETSEIKELLEGNYINGHMKISAKKSLCWY